MLGRRVGTTRGIIVVGRRALCNGEERVHRRTSREAMLVLGGGLRIGCRLGLGDGLGLGRGLLGRSGLGNGLGDGLGRGLLGGSGLSNGLGRR